MRTKGQRSVSLPSKSLQLDSVEPLPMLIRLNYVPVLVAKILNTWVVAGREGLLDKCNEQSEALTIDHVGNVRHKQDGNEISNNAVPCPEGDASKRNRKQSIY